MSSTPAPLTQLLAQPQPAPVPVDPAPAPMPVEPASPTGPNSSDFLGLEAIWEQITSTFGGAGALLGGLVVLGGVFLLVLILTDA